MNHFHNFHTFFVLEKSGKFQKSYRLATEQSHLDIPGYNEMTLTKGLKMATLVCAKKALNKLLLSLLLLEKPQTTNFKSIRHQKSWRQLDDGRIVTSVQIFCMCILQQNVILFH